MTPDTLPAGWQLWWLSYAGDEGSHGVVLIAGQSFLHACGRSKHLGISPGGQVQGFVVPPGEWFDRCWPLEGQLSTRQDLEARGLAMPEGLRVSHEV